MPRDGLTVSLRSLDVWIECESCSGTGYEEFPPRDPASSRRGAQVECWICSGTGGCYEEDEDDE